MTVFNHINDVQKVFENLDIDWVKITPEEKIVNLKMAIEKHYPNIKYEVIILNDPQGKEYYLKHMRYMRYKEDDFEIARIL
jgi:hypothetical protein